MTTTDLEKNEFLFNDSNLSGVNVNSQGINVKVTDYSYGNVNPSPIKLPKDTELLEEFLSPRKLQALTGVDNLETVEYLEMRVNTDQMSLGNFGMYLPNLTQIKLSGSYIPTIRDLGTSLWNLQVLWMPQCCLHCLDGLVTMANMKELYLAYNEIEDISSCGMLENLEILDLEGNHIEDPSNLHYLSMCTLLSRLTLEGNPLCSTNKYTAPMTYRQTVFDSISQLEYLDDIPKNYCNKLPAGDSYENPAIPDMTTNATLEFEDHWNFINSMLVESGLLADSERSKGSMSPETPDDSGRPSSSTTSSARLQSARPISAMRPMSAQRRALTTALSRPGTSINQRPSSAINTELEDKTDDSNLTAGKVVCGNITKSLRRHSEDSNNIKSPRMKIITESRPKTCVKACKNKIEKAERTERNVDESCELVLEELNNWRKDYEKSKARIEKQKAPQILTIEYSEEEIEKVEINTNRNQINSEMKIAKLKNETKHLKSKADIILNPIKNGKILERELPSSWIPTNVNKEQNNLFNNNIMNTSINQQKQSSQAAPVQMSRIRRQLLQSGVSSIAPSKPLLKR